jgi:small subunit ribosomal protein S8e
MRKRTGGRRRPYSDKKKHQLGSEPTETQVGDRTFKTVATRGGTSKVRAIATDTANVATGDEVVATDIENVAENPSNPNYARRNIITKGALVETGVGLARVTSRPGQDGQVNAVLVED